MLNAPPPGTDPFQTKEVANGINNHFVTIGKDVKHRGPIPLTHILNQSFAEGSVRIQGDTTEEGSAVRQGLAR